MSAFEKDVRNPRGETRVVDTDMLFTQAPFLEILGADLQRHQFTEDVMHQPLLLDDISEVQANRHFPDFSDTDYFSYDDVEAELQANLEKELAAFEPIEYAPITVSDINCKWKYSSAMQKSIRRGFVSDAVKYALVFHRLDSTAFWTRLVLVGAEDVGLGGVMELALTLIAAKSKAWRRKVGEENVVQFIVQMLTRSVKDRSCTDYMISLWYTARKQKDLSLLKTATLPELSGFVLSEKNSTAFRTSAAWILSGAKYENKNLPLRLVTSKEILISTIAAMKIPALIKYVCLRGLTASRYPMPLMLPFLWQMKQKSIFFSVERATFPERYYIGGLPSESWDQYVREGKSSLAYFGKACRPVDDWLTQRGIISRDARVAALGAAVFIFEGAMLDRTLIFEGSSEITETAEKYDYANAGLSLDDGRALARMIEANSDILRQSRIRIVTEERG